MKIRLDIRFLKVAVCFLAGLALFLAGMLIHRAWEEGAPRPASDTPESGKEMTDSVYFDGRQYVPRGDLETTLVLGIDKFTDTEIDIPVHGEYEQADFILLLVFDARDEQCRAIHINRDAMAKITMLSDAGAQLGIFTGQLALAHAYGGDGKMRCRNTVKAVSNLFYGIKIDHYLSLTMDGVILLNDYINGVEVEILDDFTGIDDTLKKGERITLLGQHALNYIRTRYGLEDSSNLHRMERQKQYLDALQSKLLKVSKDNEDFADSVLLKVNSYFVSDCTVNQLSELAGLLRRYGISEYLTLKGEAVRNNAHVEYYIDEQALRELIVKLFYEIQPENGEDGGGP